MRLGDLVELSEHGKNATFKDPDGYEVVAFEQQHARLHGAVATRPRILASRFFGGDYRGYE